MTDDELIVKIEEALTDGLQRELDVHDLAVFIVEHVRKPPPQSMSRQEIVAQRLKEI